MPQTQERSKHEQVGVGAGLPEGWTEAGPGRMATNPDPLRGGIIDRTIVGGEWFVIFNRPDLGTLEGFATRESAFEAFNRVIPASAALRTDISRVAASAVHVGDKICFDQSRFDVVVERISEAPDGAIGFHGNDETWSTWRKPLEIVWVDSALHDVLERSVDRRAAIETELAKSGLRMEYDPGSIPGEGHVLVSIGTGEWADAPTDAVAALAREWSDLTDQAEAETDSHLNLRDAAPASTEQRSMDAAHVDFEQANFVLYEKSSAVNIRVTGIEEAIAAIDDAGPDSVLKVVVHGGAEQDVWRAAGDEYVDHAFSVAVEQVREARSFRP